MLGFLLEWKTHTLPTEEMASLTAALTKPKKLQHEVNCQSAFSHQKRLLTISCRILPISPSWTTILLSHDTPLEAFKPSMAPK